MATSDLILVGGSYSDRAAITHHAQAAARWEVLLKLIVVAITMAEPCWPASAIVLVHINFIAKLSPIDARGLRSCQPEDNEHNQQEHAAGADSAWANSFALGAMVFDQLDHSPENDQRGPVTSKPAQQWLRLHHSQRRQEQDCPEDNQHHRPCERARTL